MADRGFLLADGLFETIKIFEGQPILLAEHLERLSSGAQRLNIPYALTLNEVEQAISNLISEHRLTDPLLCGRLTLTRGPGPRGVLPPDAPTPTLLLTLSPYSLGPVRPWTLSVATNRRNEHSIFSQMKSLAYTENVFARLEAKKAGADDALFLNTQGFVACTSMANIFIVEKGLWLTPPITDGVLPGITRAQIISNKKAEERSLTLKDCREADEVYICNSLMGLQPIGAIHEGPEQAPY